MDVICPQCGTTYELDESQIQGKSVRVKCSACEYMFRVYRPTPSQIIPALQTWIVRSADGVVSHVPDQSTLQRMIVEHKVSRTDELSRDGRAWQLMGDVPDFQPFFALVERATVSSNMLQAVADSGVAFSAVPGIQATTPDISGVTGTPFMDGGVQLNAAVAAAATAAGLPGAVLIAGEMDPKSTLEFGLPGYAPAEPAKTDIGIKAVPADGAIPVSYGKGSAEGLPRPQFSGAGDATEVAVEGISPSEAELVQSSAKPVSLAPLLPPPEDDPLSSPTLPATPDMHRPVAGSGSLELAVRVSPPTSTSFEGQAVVSRDPEEGFDLAPEKDSDWFMGSMVDIDAPASSSAAISAAAPASASSLSFDDDAPGSPKSSLSLDTGMRDFSSYHSDDYSEDSVDDFAIPQASNKGMWVVLTILGLALVLGGFYVLMPELAGRLNVAIGISEATPAALAKVRKAQAQLGGFTVEDFNKAQSLLTEAEQTHGGAFPSSLAGRIEVELARTELRLFQMDLATRQRGFWEKKKKEIDADIAKLPVDDPNKATNTLALLQKKKAYQAQVDKSEERRLLALSHYKKHWKAASGYRTAALASAPKHIAVEMAELHLYSLSSDAGKQFRPLYAKLLKKSESPAIQTRLFLLAAWVSLHQKEYKQSLNRIRKVITDQPKWVYPRLLQARAWADSNRDDDAVEGLRGLFKHAPKHAEASAFLRYLAQKSAAPTAPRTPAPVAGTPVAGTPAAGTPAGTPAAGTPAAGTPATRRTPPRAVAVRRRSPPRAAGGSFRGLMRRASRLRRNEKYSSARRYYLRALKIKKTSRAYSGLAWCLLESSGPAAAITYFQRAQRMSRRNPDAVFGLGMAYRRQRKTAKARATLKLFLSRFSRHRDAGEVRMILKSLR